MPGLLRNSLGRARLFLVFALIFGASAVIAAPTDLPEFSSLVEANRGAVVNIRAHRFDAREGAPMRPRLPYGGFGREPRMPDGHPELDPDLPEKAQGSGFLISDDGYILTNAHVVARADDVRVRMADKREFRARTVGIDRRTDIALLKITATGLPKVALGDPEQLKVGDWVLAIGSPFGFEQSVTAGIVSAKARSLPYENFVPFIQTDVAINPGNSGGPLFNLKGEVVGINSQIFSRTGGFMGLAFSIPIDMAMAIQTQLRENGRVQRGRIGVVIQEVSPSLSSAFGLSEPQGALVSSVQEAMPAQAAGVLQGDIVLEFDGKRVATSADLPRLVAATMPGSEVPMVLWREGARVEMQIRVAELRDERRVARTSTAVGESDNGHDRLGLVVAEPSLMQKRQLQIEGGVIIERRRGAAAASELESGDVIEAVVRKGLRHEVRVLADYQALLEALEPGAHVSLLVRRGRASSFVGLRAD